MFDEMNFFPNFPTDISGQDSSFLTDATDSESKKNDEIECPENLKTNADFIFKEGKKIIGTIRSEGNPQKGQKHRSSDNFAVNIAKSGDCNAIKWEISETSRADKIVFNVMNDRKARSDETIFANLKNGSITEIKNGSKLYIADPRNTNGESFTVSAKAHKK